MRVAFLHPDLGLGGAERLIVDAALALSLEGHVVTLYTSHYDKDRAFEETKGRIFPVRVHGDFLPRHILGTLHILFAILRQCYLALAVLVTNFMTPYDVIILDQVSAPIPLIRMLAPSSRTLFYCHFPDQLLSSRKSLLKSLYRLPFDLVEEVTTLMADMIVVNSKFTARVFAKTFRLACGWEPDVLYPCVSIDEDLEDSEPSPPRPTLLSINRFERKKNLGLAIDAFAEMRREHKDPSRLVLAGGYDPRLSENVEYHIELDELAKRHGLTTHTGSYSSAPPSADVVFVRSFTDADKAHLLEDAALVIYTPKGEHFGIVPLEAMAAWRPVLAVDDAGPRETVIHKETGFLEHDDVASFARRMRETLAAPALRRRLGKQARHHVRTTFAMAAMRRRLRKAMKELQEGGRAGGGGGRAGCFPVTGLNLFRAACATVLLALGMVFLPRLQ